MAMLGLPIPHTRDFIKDDIVKGRDTHIFT